MTDIALKLRDTSMHRLTTYRSALIAVVLSLLFITSVPPLSAHEPEQDGPLSTLSNIAFYPLIANGKTDIAIAACANVANFQLRSEKPNVWMSQIFVRSTRCPVAVAGSWRAVVSASPGECFIIYGFATEAALSDADFMARSARYSVCVTALGAISSPQQQSVTAPLGAIDTPAAGATVQGTIPVSGWAIDGAAWSGTGVDQVQVYNGSALLGTASYGQGRSDVATAYGDTRYTNSGYVYQLDTTHLTNGTTTLQVRAHSTISGQWRSLQQTVTIANATVGGPISPPPPPPTLPSGSWNVPYYSQGNPQWGNNKIGACNSTISRVGCALTSLAMIFRSYGANHNPGTLNTCLGSDACLLRWYSSRIGTCSGGKVTFAGSPAFSYARLDQELKKRPVILELYNSGTGNAHFIVVISGSGNDPSNYRVNDPGVIGGEHRTLRQTLNFWYTYKNRHLLPHSLRLFNGTPSVASDGTLSAPAPQLAPPDLSGSEVVSGTAAIYYSTDTDVILELAAQSSAGTVTDMRLWTDQSPSNIWQPLSAYVQAPLDQGAIYTQFRDDAGNTSAVIEADVPVSTVTNIEQTIYQAYLPMLVR